MGEVLLARRRGPGGIERLVAVKTIRPELSGAEHVRAMFLDEAGILSRLTHPAVATIHDFGEDGRTLYLVMEYVAGISFGDLVDRRPPPTVAARAIAEACRGLHAAHELRDLGGNLLGVVHRDISPENLMLGFDGHVKVIDFGIALVRGRQAPVTELGTIKGKPPYMSPEQVKNEPIDRRSDVFSIAVVLHELLTGQPLFGGDSIYAVARAVEHGELAPPSRAAGALPAGLDAAVMRALERDKARRTPTAAAFAEELEQVVMAAGDETLEAWAERELAGARTGHRNWLARILAGGTVTKIGRDSGVVTALPEAPVDLAHAPTPEAAAPRALEPPASSRRGLIAGVIVLVILLGGLGAWLATRPGPASAPDAARVVAVTVDAAVVIPVDEPVDAASVVVAADASPPPPRRDARVRVAQPRPDARARPPAAVDARAPAATGTAYLSAGAKPYALVFVNGAYFKQTPFAKEPIRAGRVRVVLKDPQTDEVRADRTFDLAPGDSVTIKPDQP